MIKNRSSPNTTLAVGSGTFAAGLFVSRWCVTAGKRFDILPGSAEDDAAQPPRRVHTKVRSQISQPTLFPAQNAGTAVCGVRNSVHVPTNASVVSQRKITAVDYLVLQRQEAKVK